MRTFFLYFIIVRLLGNPLLAIAVLAVIYLLVDRRFIGLLPDFTRPIRRASRWRQLRGMVELNPANAGAQLELGQLLCERRRYHEALPLLEKAGQKLGDHATAQFYLGVAYIRTGDLAAGRAALLKAVALRPSVQYGEPYVYLAEAALDTEGRAATDQAPGAAAKKPLAEWVDTVLRYGNTEVCYRMGAVLRRRGQEVEAVRLFREALAGYKQSPAFARKQGRRWAFLAWLALRLGGGA